MPLPALEFNKISQFLNIYQIFPQKNHPEKSLWFLPLTQGAQGQRGGGVHTITSFLHPFLDFLPSILLQPIQRNANLGQMTPGHTPKFGSKANGQLCK